jgi:hypothetical protein
MEPGNRQIRVYEKGGQDRHEGEENMRNSHNPLVKFLIIYTFIGGILAFLAAAITLIVDFVVFGRPAGTFIFMFLIAAAIFFAIMSILFFTASLLYKASIYRNHENEQ